MVFVSVPSAYNILFRIRIIGLEMESKENLNVMSFLSL